MLKSPGDIHPRIQVIDDTVMRRQPRTSLNRLPDISDWRAGSLLCRYMQAMGEGPYIHRKAWEYGICVLGLHRLGVVHPFAQGLAVAAGYERPYFYFTNHIEHMTATDLYDNPDHEGKPEIVLAPEKFAPIPFRRERLTVLAMNAMDLQFPENKFDFAFCLSSIEHYGPRANSIRAMQEIEKVLKPGGIACIATELILNSTSHGEYFTPEEFDEVILGSTSLQLVGGDFDYRISESIVNHPIDLQLDDLTVSPHLVLKSGSVVFTSAICFLQKPH